jgi:hypothetical protein
MDLDWNGCSIRRPVPHNQRAATCAICTHHLRQSDDGAAGKGKLEVPNCGRAMGEQCESHLTVQRSLVVAVHRTSRNNLFSRA